ncbi:MAG: ATP-binding protein [Clostridia bacterium]|nr:ATP-binding protein [Clostridia bacterium]
MALTKDGRGFSDACNFMNIVSKEYYVDKSLLIRDLIDNNSRHPVMLFTRPRRFGKSLNISMIRIFFEKTRKDNSVYFNDLDIWKCGEQYTSEQGKYPVISLDFKECESETFQGAMTVIKDTLAVEFARHTELKKSRRIDRGHDLKIYNKIVGMNADTDEIKKSLSLLSRMLYAHHGVKPIILIDEYDIPVQAGYERGYYSQITDFFRDFLSAALKGNDNLEFAVITGVTRTAKAGIFSGLNNLAVYSVSSDEYSQYFGFTKDEVKKILDDFGHPEKMDEICEWYDGYKFGETEIFNPWSVSHYVDKNFAPETYWAGTSSNSIIKDMLHVTTAEISAQILDIVQGRETVVPINENVPYATLKENPSNVFSILLAGGYLKVTKREGKKYTVVIPNKEVRDIYEDEITGYVWRGSSNAADRIRRAFMESDADTLYEAISYHLMHVANWTEMAVENAYQVFMITLSLNLNDVYEVMSNSKSGYGLFDIEMTPRNRERGLPGILIECEHRKDESELEKAVEHALNQIEERRYDANLLDKGITKIDKYGIAFSGQKVVLKKK